MKYCITMYCSVCENVQVPHERSTLRNDHLIFMPGRVGEAGWGGGVGSAGGGGWERN